MKPIVTALMIIYNGKDYLNEAIESVLFQQRRSYP